MGGGEEEGPNALTSASRDSKKNPVCTLLLLMQEGHSLVREGLEML